VHLIHAELFDELRQKSISVYPRDLGENITTSGIDLLGLSAGAKLHLGATAVVEVTGLRNPCVQIDKFQRGLMAATLAKDAAGNLIRKTGIMSIVLAGGDVRPDEPILVERPAGIPKPLQVV
jgi:MOSC domain-containing protein YiiM